MRNRGPNAKTDPVSPSYLAHRLATGCPMCGAALAKKSRGRGDEFWVCPRGCAGSDGAYYYVSAHGEKRYDPPRRNR